MVEQIEVIQEAVSTGVSKLNDSVINKEPDDKKQFSPNKHSRKGKWI